MPQSSGLEDRNKRFYWWVSEKSVEHDRVADAPWLLLLPHSLQVLLATQESGLWKLGMLTEIYMCLCHHASGAGQRSTHHVSLESMVVPKRTLQRLPALQWCPHHTRKLREWWPHSVLTVAVSGLHPSLLPSRREPIFRVSAFAWWWYWPWEGSLCGRPGAEVESPLARIPFLSSFCPDKCLASPCMLQFVYLEGDYSTVPSWGYGEMLC